MKELQQLQAQSRDLSERAQRTYEMEHSYLGSARLQLRFQNWQSLAKQAVTMAQLQKSAAESGSNSQRRVEWNRMLVTSYHDKEDWHGRKLGPGSIAVANTNLKSLSDDWRHTPVALAYPEGTRMNVYFDNGSTYSGVVRDWGRGNLEPRLSLGAPHGVAPRQWIDIWTRREEIAQWATVQITYGH
jgi:hypothetical protein